MRLAIASLLAVWAVFVVAVLRLDLLLADWLYNRLIGRWRRLRAQKLRGRW